MRLQRLCAVSVLALAAVACTPKEPPAARARLDCPDKQGALTRTAAAPDGRSCRYRAADGTDVELRLAAAPAGVEAMLAGVEQELLAAVPPPSPETAPGSDSSGARAAQAAEAEAQADAAGDSDGDEAPARGVRITTDDGERTQVDLPGVHIRTENDSARLKIGPVHIDAQENEATVQMLRDVRLRGEALSREKRGVRAMFFRAADDGDGYRYVGYEAGGPKAGPLTVALVRSRKGDADELRKDVDRLVRRNGGV
jgi:hypothetical protein